MDHGANIVTLPKETGRNWENKAAPTMQEIHLYSTAKSLFREADDVASVNAIADAKNVLSEQYSLKDEAIRWIEAFWNEYENFQKFTKMDYAELRNIYLENLKLNKEIASLKKEIEDSKSLKEEYDKLKKAYDKVYQVYYEEMKKSTEHY